MTRSPDALVDELARLAREAEPAPIDESGARKLVDRALLAARAPDAPQRSLMRPLLAIAASCAAVLLAWVLLRRPATDAPLLELSLPTGDRVVGVPGSQIDLEQLTPEHRRIRMKSGTLMFDVAHVVPNQRFEVVTNDLVAIARGTIFSVETNATGSRVRVYEGTVEVTQLETSHLLAAGTSWDSRNHSIAPSSPPRALASSVARAIEARAHATATATVPATPTVPVPVPATATDPGTPVAVSGSGERQRQAVAVSGSGERQRQAVAVSGSGERQRQAVAVSGSGERPAEPAAAAAADADADTVAAADPDTAAAADPLATARAHLAAGRFSDVIALYTTASAHPPVSAAWHLLAGDAYRGLDDIPAAATAYDTAAQALPTPDSIEPSYTAAYLRFSRLHDAAGALASLTPATYAESSPLEERALGLRAQILDALANHADAREAAQHYLQRFPRGDLRTLMQRLSTSR